MRGQRVMDIKRCLISADIDRDKKEAFTRLAKNKGMKTSEYIRYLVNREIENAKRSNH